MNLKFDTIRPFYDSEVNAAVRSIMHDPMMTAILKFTFPEKTENERLEILSNINSIQAFKGDVVYYAMQNILAQSSEGLSTSGFEKLDKNTAYLYISNHRDIFLDTSLLNFALFERDLIMTATAIGDNLVRLPFFHTLAKLHRNFLVLRGLPPRELLQSSKILSEYINELLSVENRSVWIAQREGRTKDGNDATHQGVLKMIAMAAGKGNIAQYLKNLRIVPISISYEYDPTDSLKLPELLANKNNEVYVKHEREDFDSIMKGILGQKKHIHIHAGDVLDDEMDEIMILENANQQVKAIAQLIDKQIVRNYRLWASNYIAYDLLHQSNKYTAHYTSAEKKDFEERLASKVDAQNEEGKLCFLNMYANPVVNKMALQKEMSQTFAV